MSGLHILVLDPLFRLPAQPGPTRTFGIAKRLIQAGHRVSVLTTSAALPEATPSEVDGIRIDAVPEGRARFGFPPATGAFARAVPWRIWRHEDVDVVLAADCPAPALLAAMLFCGERAAALLLDVRRLPNDEAPAQAFQAALAAAGRGITRSAMRFARRVFAVTPEIRERLIAQGIPAARVTVSPLAADTALAVAGEGENPLPVAGRVLLYAGPFAAEGVERLVHIAKAMETAQPADPFHIVVCGDGPARPRLEALAREAGVLEKTLWIAAPLSPRTQGAAFAAASAVVAPSSHDDMEGSAAFFDGLAAGKPMVIWGSGPNRELIESRAAGIGLPADPAVAVRELADFLRDADGLRRAGSQALALAGRFGLERTTAEIRAAVEEAAAAAPRLVVLRERMLRTKRIIDIAVSAAGLILLSPVMAAIAIAICVKMGWPPVFTQERPGLKGETFRIYKFRTMSSATDAAGALLPDEARLTPLGKFLRRFSLDELPELFNVLRGDMSLVGPRPLLPEYIPHYTAEQRRRHELRPGVTGWSQINGRNAASWEDRFKLDVWYVDNLSLWLDFKIILKTAWIAITGEGVNAPGHATMPRFDEVVARREGAEDI